MTKAAYKGMDTIVDFCTKLGISFQLRKNDSIFILAS